MDRIGQRVVTFAEAPVFVPLALLLVAVRFSAPTVMAFLGVQGVDTAGLEAAFDVYAGILPAVLFLLAAALLLPRYSVLRGDWRFLLAAALTMSVVVLWAGEADSGLRLVVSPWTSLALGVFAATAIVAFERSLEGAGNALSADSRSGLRALGWGFALAYLLKSLRLVDYRDAAGVSLPSGVLWVLDYGPVLVLSFLAIFFWFRIAVRPARSREDWAWALLPPALAAGLGTALGQGVGRVGFIVSNALAWGGAYTIFAPTLISLGLVGLAGGAFAAVAKALRPRLARDAWRLVVGGIAMACFAGILPFGGTLASLAGIVLGLACAARGLGRKGTFAS